MLEALLLPVSPQAVLLVVGPTGAMTGVLSFTADAGISHQMSYCILLGSAPDNFFFFRTQCYE